VVRDLVGDQTIEPEITSVSTWTVNNMYATHMQSDRVFIMGDAAHRHPPSNGLGSNTSIQDAFNLAWKLAAVIKGQAGESLLDSYSEERAPVAKQIVTRANQSIGEFGPIFEALGLTESTDPEVMQANMDKRCDTNIEAERQRAAIREAIAFKKYEFDAHGVEMNQRYKSSAWSPMARWNRPSNSMPSCTTSRRHGRAHASRMLGLRSRWRQAFHARSGRPGAVHDSDRHQWRAVGRGRRQGRRERWA
jgi:hypothetical protein